MLGDGRWKWYPPGLLSLERQRHFSQMCSKKPEPYFPVHLRGSSDCAICASGVVLSSPQKHCSTLRAPHQPCQRPLKLQSLSLADCKTHKSQSLSFSQSVFLGEMFSLCDPLCTSPHTSLFPLFMTKVPSPPQYPHSISPQSLSLHLLPSTWKFFSLSPQINFLDIQNDLIFV